MATVLLYCKNTPGLKLGPELPGHPSTITFVGGYAELDDTAPDFAKRMSFVNTPGCPHIEIVTEAQATIQRAVDAALAKAERNAHGLE